MDIIATDKTSAVENVLLKARVIIAKYFLWACFTSYKLTQIAKQLTPFVQASEFR